MVSIVKSFACDSFYFICSCSYSYSDSSFRIYFVQIPSLSPLISVLSGLQYYIPSSFFTSSSFLSPLLLYHHHNLPLPSQYQLILTEQPSFIFIFTSSSQQHTNVLTEHMCFVSLALLSLRDRHDRVHKTDKNPDIEMAQKPSE